MRSTSSSVNCLLADVDAVGRCPSCQKLNRWSATCHPLVGRTIQRVEVYKPKLFDATPGLTLEDLFGRRIERIWRRGKLSVWELSDELSLVVHLKLARQLVHVSPDGQEIAHGGHPVPMWGSPLPHKSTHIVFCLDDSSILYLTDIRQFARVHLMRAAEVDRFLKHQKIGVEPLTRRFTARALGDKLKRRSIPLKTAIMDQSVVGGIGNIYADESLWRAKLHPRRRRVVAVGSRSHALASAIRAVLDYAVREGAAFVPHGKAISDRDFPYCHGRAGSPCPRCRTIIQKEWVGGRGTHFCPAARRRPALPELPEVETTARGLRARLIDRMVVSIGSVDWPRMLPNTSELELQDTLVGGRVVSIGRKGKYLLIELDGDRWLVIHRKMSGNLLLEPADAPLERHTHLEVVFDDGTALRFVDPRNSAASTCSDPPTSWPLSGRAPGTRFAARAERGNAGQ